MADNKKAGSNKCGIWNDRLTLSRHVATAIISMLAISFTIGATYAVMADNVDELNKRSENNVLAIEGLKETLNELATNQRVLSRDNERNRKDIDKIQSDTNKMLGDILTEVKKSNKNR